MYNTGLSTLESIAGNKAFGFLNLARMGLSSMESTYNDAIDRDATNEEAMGASMLAGLAEVVFEKVSLENFIKLSGGKGAGKFVMNVVKQGGIEASEETCTELANALTDYLTMGGRSNYSRDIEAYMSRGMSEDEARRNALLNVCKNVGLAGAGGFLSGGVSGTFAQGTAAYNRRAAEKAKQAAKAKADSAQGAAGQTAEEAAQAPTGVNEVKGAALRSLEAHDPQGGGQPTITIRNRQGEVEEAATAAAREANRGGSATAAPDAATSTAEEAPAEQGGLAQTETQLERATREYYRLEELYEQEPAPETKALMDEAERRIAEEIEAAEQLEQAAQTHARGEAAQQETKPAPVMHRQAETEAGEAVTVTGVESAEDGVVYYRVEHQDGTTGVLDARDVEIADADVSELLASERARRLGTTGMAEYLDNYNPELARPEQYAHAYVDVYARARVGMSYEQAVNGDMELSAYLDATAAGAAYEAGVADSRRNAQSGARMAANVAVQRNANEGRAAGQKDGNGLKTGNAGVVAGKGNAQGETVFSLKETRGMNWAEQVNKVRDTTISSSATLNLGKSGSIYAEFGMADMDIGMNIGDMRKAMREKSGSRSAHGLSEAVVLALPGEIANPVAVFDNPVRNCAYVLTKQRDSDGNPVVAVVAKNARDGSGTSMHQVKSAYGMKDVAAYMKEHLPENAKKTVYNKTAFNQMLAGSHHIMNGPDYQTKEERRKTSIPKTAEKSKAASGVARRYTQAAWEGLAEGKSAEERRRIHAQARAQLTALDRLARNLGVKITVVDAIQGQANGMYNPKTGEITIALDAMNGAYLYTAMHELTHKLKNEHGAEWAAFENLVRSALETNGVNINEEIAHQLAVAKRNGLTLSREAALEEVICNAASGVLTDEAVIKRMVTENRTLAQRIGDFLKGFLEALDKAIAEAGERLGRYRSWGDSFKALQRDRQSAKRIYDALMEGLGSGTETQGREGAEGAREGLTESGSAGREKMKYSTPPGGRLASNGIERDMNDAKRAEVLRSIAMEVVPTAALSPEGQALVERLGRGGIGRNEIDKAIRALPEYKAIQGVDLHSDSITVPFRFSNHSLNETLTKMMAGGKFDFLKAQRFVRLLGNFSEQLKKATAVEVHTDRYLGRVKTETDIENFGVLFGMSEMEGTQIPVLYELKNYTGNMKDNLYLVATFGEIKKGTTQRSHYAGKSAIQDPHVVTSSIADYVKKIHTRDEKLLKYFPDELLSPEQAGSAKAGRLEEEKYILKKIGVGSIDLKTGRAVTQEQLDELDARIERARNGDEPEPPLADSDGRKLSAKQSAYFKHSKARDENGNLLTLYHGTMNAGFTRFENQLTDGRGAAFFFTDSRDTAVVYAGQEREAFAPSRAEASLFEKVSMIAYREGFAEKYNMEWKGVYEAYLDLRDPLELDAKGAYWDKLRGKMKGKPGTVHTTDDWAEYAREKGYDGLLVRNVRDGSEEVATVCVAFEPRQVKSVNNADPTGDPDIRYSLRDTDEHVQEGLTTLESALAQTRAHRITAMEADELAGRIIKAANSTYDRQRLAGEISRIYDYAERGGADIMQLDDEQTALMARVMEKSRVLDLEHEERMKPVRDYLRTTKISLTDTMLREAENQFGSVQAYRRAVFGRVRLNQTSGTPLDSVWGELSTLAPELFDEEASEGDMARLLLAAVDAARPQYTDGRGMSAEESAQYFAGELNRAYLSLPGVKASAKNKAKLNVSAQTYANAMKRFADASWTEYQNALRGLEEGRREQKRTERQKHAAAMRRKYAQWRERDAAMRRERELQNRWRPKIEQTTAALLRWYENPTDAKHIPEDLRETVLGVVASLDFTGGNTRKAGALSRQIAALADALDKASAEPDVASDGFTIERDQMWIDHLNMLARMIPQHKAVYELNGAELRELSKWMDSVRHVLTEVNRMHGTNLGSVAETAEASIAEMKGKKPYYLKSGALKAWSDTFGIEMQDSFTFFKRLGPTAYRVFENVRKGFDKSVENLREAKEYMEALLKGINVKGMSGKAAPKTKYALQSGDVVKLTRAQVMELYCLNRREQARRHLYGGGIRIDGDANVRAHALTRQDVAAITGTMTAAEIRIADGIQRFLSVNCARWGNETSMLFFGYRKFTEHSYYPIRTDSNTNKTTMLDDASEMARISAIRNAGMTKATTQGASNAIVLGSIFDTYTRHVSQMNAYNAYAIPLYDMQRWMNTRGVKTEIEQLYGKAGTKYVMNFFKAINGTAERSESPMTKPVRWLTRNAKTAAVGANIQVAIQQPTSYVRAISMISGKYLAQGVKMKKQPHLVDKYCAIAQWKKWGFYETDVGPNLKSMLLNDQTPVEKAKDASLWLAGKGDEWTLNHLWNACELETQDLYPELKQGTEEYYRQVGARMSEIVDRTQVVDSVFHRSQAMRRKDSYTQLLTSFMAEPIKSYNMVMESVAEYAESRGTKNVAMARRKLVRALTAYALCGALAAAAKSLTGALRDDDEDKAYWEKYIDRLGANLLNAINPLSNIPIISDTIETVTNGGQSANRLDSQSIERIGWLVEEVRKLNEGKSTLNWYGMTYKTMQTVSSVTGVPISNLMRDANAIVQTATGRNPTLSETGSRSIAKDNLYKAMIGGDKEAQKRLRQKMKNELGMGEKEIDAAMGERLARDERIAAGWEAKTEKRVGDVNRLKNALAKEGFTGEMVDKAIKTYGNSVTVDEDTGEDKDEPLRVSLYTQDEAAEAVRGVAKGTVNAEDVKLMLSEMAADSTVKGTEGERQQSVIGSVQSRLKPEYLKMERAGDEKGMKALERAMNDALGTREETFAAWRTDDHSARLREAVDARDSKAAKEAVARCRKDGRDDSSIKSSLSAYKAAYIEAYRAGDRTTANEIRRMLKGLGLKSRKGDALYADETFAEWLEGKK